MAPKALVYSSIALASLLPMFAQEPTWWHQPDAAGFTVIDPNAPPDNLGLANVGQAKYMALRAKTALSSAAPVIAKDIDLDAIFAPPPQAPDADWLELQKAPLNLGQLKAIAEPFYSALDAHAPAWVAQQASANGIAWTPPFPWDPATPLDVNLQPTVIGQLKSVFSLRFNQASGLDHEPDLFKWAYFGTDDIELDLTTAQRQITLATPDPTIRDSDNDGITDAEEILLGTDPFSADLTDYPTIPWQHLTVRLDPKTLDPSTTFHSWADQAIDPTVPETDNYAIRANASTPPSVLADAFAPGVHGLNITSKARSVRLNFGDDRIFNAHDPAKLGMTIVVNYRIDQDLSNHHTDRNSVFEMLKANSRGFFFEIRRDRVPRFLQTGSSNAWIQTITSDEPLPLGQPKVLAVSYHGHSNDFSLFIDGQAKGRAANAVQPFNAYLNQPQKLWENLYLGKWTSHQTPNGTYGTVMVFNRALTNQEHQTLANYLEAIDQGTGPLAADSNNDGIPDWRKIELGLDPSKIEVNPNWSGDFADWLLALDLDPDQPGIANAEFQDAGITNIQAFNAGLLPLPNATPDDFDGDGLENNLDADPLDPATRWLKAPESQYVALPIEAPFDQSIHNLGLRALGSDGRILASYFSRSPVLSNGSPAELITAPQAATKVWMPSNALWMSLDLDTSLIGGGTHIDGTGNIYGDAWVALGENETFPGANLGAFTSLVNPPHSYLKASPFGNNAQYEENSFSNESGTFTNAPPLTWPLLAVGGASHLLIAEIAEGSGGNGNPKLIAKNGSPTSLPIEELPAGALSDDALANYLRFSGAESGLLAYSSRSQVGADWQHKLIRVPALGEAPDDGHTLIDGPAASNSPVSQVARINPAQHPATLNGEPAPTGETYLWLSDNGPSHIRQADNTWTASARPANDPLRLRGKVNARGECLVTHNGTPHLLRNATLTPLATFIDPEQYTILQAIDINDAGMILTTATTPNGQIIPLLLMPVEMGPEVLAVNSNFDEGRIDPNTGYAIPDCDDVPGDCPVTGDGNTLMALEAKIDHLDGNYSAYERVTNNLHDGWFGVNPKTMGNEFWDGANVTISKIDRIDDETDRPESGQVRFYAKWGNGPGQYRAIPSYNLKTLVPVNLVTGGINQAENESVYGSNSIIPPHSKFYIEGVRPGKITLEWRYQKGALDIKHEQTFLVATQQSVAEWREEVRYQIRLQTKVATGSEVDVALYHPGNGFRNTSSSSPPENDNVARVQAIYYYYQQLFKQMPEKFMWAGMAKTAAAPIYAGMSDLTTLWQVQELAGGYGAGTYSLTRGLLCGGQKAIFTDKAWAHMAYMASGKWALEWVELQTAGNPPTDFEAWSALNDSILDEDQVGINAANHDLLQREQRDVVQRYYFNYTTNIYMKQPPLQSWVGAVAVAKNSQGLVNVGEWLSANALKNPMPGGPAFRVVVVGGRIDNYQNRWDWTANAANGMLSIWTGDATDASAPKFNAGKRLSENNKTMYSAAAAYSFDVGGLPIE